MSQSTFTPPPPHPAQFGRISLRQKAGFGMKVRTQTRTGVAISNNQSTLFAEDKLGGSDRPRNEYELLPTWYQVYSCDGLAFPFGLPYPPAGHWDTLIFDKFNGIARGLKLKESCLTIGGSTRGYKIHTRPYIQQAVLSPTTLAIQLSLAQLLFGLLVTSSVGDRRVGETFRPMSTIQNSANLCLGFTGGRQKRQRPNDCAAYSREGDVAQYYTDRQRWSTSFGRPPIPLTIRRESYVQDLSDHPISQQLDETEADLAQFPLTQMEIKKAH